ncbi:rhomboid family intramembrane serine protease [Pedobacter gandavensis]|uniref:Rhomboid family intramembrane serine protease n=1 Tax=Pedobacter gandavensis TaxID=2679963 RepID=A0ABR6EXH0_9SPHI|nr:rhomboid family intramembrane serine protease [Pedobacter gandavensis]MBB2149978.1 rhomboid family intramembrane serine protease [Pedobacter gandavensis]
MGLSWGYSPKVEKYIPLGDYPADRYLIIAQQTIENLGWKLSHISESGLIAYTGISLQSYGEEISIRIKLNFAVFKSECIGIQLLFNDYGKNDLNLQKFFDEFEYVQFHLKDVWEERLAKFHEHIATQDDQYFEKSPLAVKNKIKNVLYLFIPRKGYLVTPILLILNILYYLLAFAMLRNLYQQIVGVYMDPIMVVGIKEKVFLELGANSRAPVLGGQIWRLISHQFIHLSYLHLFFNMYALVYIGLMIENKLGSWKTFAVYLLSGICGGLISVIHHQIGYMAGASGAIMGMFGAFLALLISKAFEKNANKALLISTLIVVAFMLLNGLLGKNVDNAAHFGGLIAGFILGYLLYNPVLFKRSVPIYWRSITAFLLVFAFGLGVMLFSPIYQVKEYRQLQEEFIKNEDLFKKVYNINWAMSKEEKLKLVKTCAIDSWKDNQKILAKMQKLVLMDEDRADLKFRTKLTNRGLQIGLMMYKDYQLEDRPLKYKIQQKLNEYVTFKMADRDQLVIWD